MKNLRLLYSIILITLYGCGVYSFTGASISPEIKTISIDNFFNNSPLGPSNMSVLFTEKLKDYFQRNTGEGGRNSQNISGLTRLTLRVNASYLNNQDDQFNYENKTFSFYKDFNQNTEELSSNEQEFVEEIFDQIILDIFNSSVANW